MEKLGRSAPTDSQATQVDFLPSKQEVKEEEEMDKGKLRELVRVNEDA